MHNRLRFVLILFLLALSLFSLDLMGSPVDHKTASLPIVFEKNVGQAPSAYPFLSHYGTTEVLFSGAGVDMHVPDGKRRARIGFRLLGARPDIAPEAGAPVSSVTNYLIGNDSSRWMHGIPNLSQVVYHMVYPGIDLVFHGNGDQMEHDFRIAAGATPETIQFSIEGEQKIELDALGNLQISLADGKLVFQKPLAYQTSPRGQEAVESAFLLNKDGSVRFHVGTYDKRRELIIDPVFSFSTYLTGSSPNNVTAVTTDSTGNIYVTGYTGVDFPIVNGLQPTISGTQDAFVSKLDPTGHTLLYSTYLGGSSGNYGAAIAIDHGGNIVVAGTSGSNDFPHAGSVPPLTCQINASCFFLASLTPDGSAFNYAGLVGGLQGSSSNYGNQGRLAVDASGNAYLANVTDDKHFDITPGTLSSTVPGYPYSSTFVLKLDSAGALVYSTIIPGTAPFGPTSFVNEFIPAGIFVDSKGQVTIAGTAGLGLPSTAGVIQPTFPNDLNSTAPIAGFVLQLNDQASAINYATYVPGTDAIGGLAVAPGGNLYVAGSTGESNLPVSSTAYQREIVPFQDSGFIVKLNATGTAILAATYLEGTYGAAFAGISVDSHSNVFVGGMTSSTDFPLVNPFTSLWVYGESNADMVLAGMTPDLSSLRFGSFLSSTDQVFSASQFSAMAVDHQNNLIVVGQTLATDFPTTPESYEPAPPTQSAHGFIAKLNLATAAPSFCPDSWTIDFGQAPVKTSHAQILHLKNCGNAPLHITNIASSTASVTTSNSCGAISAGAVCPITLTFLPKDSSQVIGTLTFHDDTGISPQVISFTGQGIAPQLSPSSESVGFGHLLVNTIGAGNVLAFSNTGNAPLAFSSVSADGDFSVQQNLCKGTLNPGGYCFVTVVFSPTLAGIRTGTLRIVSNDPVYPRAGISLNGFGDALYALPLLTSLASPTVQIKNGLAGVQVYGANFYPASVIEVNGTPQATTYSNNGQLQATLDSSLTDAQGEISVSVFNPNPGGGTSVALPLTRYQVVSIDAAFLVFVPASKLLYASIPSSAPAHANTVIPINPTTGALGTPIPVGQNPGVMAASSDGNYLFVAANQDQTLQRINLSTRKVDRTFPFPTNNNACCGGLVGTDLKGIPGAPQQVVLAVDVPDYGIAEVALYNDAGLVNSIPDPSSRTYFDVSSFAYADNPLTIYALPFTDGSFFNVITIDDQGLHYTHPQTFGLNNTTGTEVVSDGTLLYTSAGQIWNPTSKTQVGSFPVTTYNDTSYPNLYNVIMDAPSGHIFVIGDESYQADSSAVVLSAYSKQSDGLTGALAFPQASGVLIRSLVRWGTNGFAFVGEDDASNTQPVYLLTSSLAAPVTANPVPVVHALTPASAPQGTFEVQITVNGQGFTEGSIVNWNGAALPTTYVARTVLTALIPASDLATSGTSSITITNPAPGGGTSSAALFSVSPLVPLVSFSQSSLTFPAQKVGTSSTAHLIALQNPGTATLSISSLSITGVNATSFHQSHTCASTLAPGANCSISVVFNPTSTGPLSASLTLTDNATGSPQTVSLKGTGD